MPKERKACPAVIRDNSGRREILAFRHPLAGNQLVKGTIEAGENPEEAAVRELWEESGVAGEAIAYPGMPGLPGAGQDWHFVLCRTGQPGESWMHRTEDGGGLDFQFLWHPLSEADDDWHDLFRRALLFPRRALSVPL